MNSTDRVLVCCGLVLLLVAYLMCQPAAAAFYAKAEGVCTGGSSFVNSQTMTQGDNISKVWRADESYTEMAAGQQIVTGPGNTEIITESGVSGGFGQKTSLAFSGGGVGWDSLYQGQTIPNVSEIACTAGQLAVAGSSVDGSGSKPLDQSINGQIGFAGPNGIYNSDKYIGGSKYALSGDFTGRGQFYGSLSAAGGAGGDENTNEQNYAGTMRRSDYWTSNLTGGIMASLDYAGTDPRSIFNETTNETADVNESVSVPVNVTFGESEDA